ncbi:hypothetical protein TNIN_118011 [Trichonephila inaurata madagascariensis]|uniref:Uncharacterized protein n=1 Tax=Trichonephila inaurata madagascariensis TaxID=2747483 RepID=A0A8X7BQ46_9ARAC|nr:hypothetical protein TNIN_118011 [Trichonephila inaurata madagascariensis]
MRASQKSTHLDDVLAFPAMLCDDVIARQICALGGNGRVMVMIKMTMRVLPMVKMRGSRVVQMLSYWRMAKEGELFNQEAVTSYCF